MGQTISSIEEEEEEEKKMMMMTANMPELHSIPV